MCLIAFAYQSHPDFPLIMVANRDEFYTRPTRPAHFWLDHPQVFAGRDLESPDLDKQGTWMGINTLGRFAAVTNFREMDFNESPALRSRGELTANFLCSSTPVTEYLETVQQQAASYKGFNLLLGENHQLFYASNRTERVQALKPGIYGLSNGALDSPWPKVLYAKRQLQAALEKSFSVETLLEILLNREQAQDDQLPETGIDIESERLLSSCFIHSDSYGTRASSCVLIDNNQHCTFLEKNWLPAEGHKKSVAGEQRFLELTLEHG